MDLMEEEKHDSILEIVERNEKALILIAETVLELAYEFKDQKYSRKPFTIHPLDRITTELEDYIHVRCGTCTIRERLEKIEQDEKENE